MQLAQDSPAKSLAQLMLAGQELDAALALLTPLPGQGVSSRIISIRYQENPLSAIGSYRVGGRYNLKDQFEALYTCDTIMTCLKELNYLVQTASGLHVDIIPPTINLSIRYNLAAILDLMNTDNQSALGTNLQELTGNWQCLQKRGQVSPTQSLGLALYNFQAIEAFKVPSARDPDAYNLVIFPDRLSGSSFLEIYDPSRTFQARLP